MDDLDEGSLCCLGCTAALDSMLVLSAGTAACPTCGELELADAASTWALIVGEQLASLEAAGFVVSSSISKIYEGSVSR